MSTQPVSLDGLLTEPGRIRDVLPDVAVDLLGRLAGLQTLLLAHLASGRSKADTPSTVANHLLTIPDVATRLSVPPAYAYELARRGEIPTVKVGRKYVRVPAAALEKWLANQALDARPHSVYRPRNRKGA